MCAASCQVVLRESEEAEDIVVLPFIRITIRALRVPSGFLGFLPGPAVWYGSEMVSSMLIFRAPLGMGPLGFAGIRYGNMG